MKRSLWIAVLAGLLCTPAAFGQSSTSSQTTDLNGTWRATTAGGSVILRFVQQGDQVKGYFGAEPKPNEGAGFEGHFNGPNAIVGRSLRPAMNGQPAVWVPQTLHIDDSNHIHFNNHPEIVRLPSLPTNQQEALKQALCMMLFGAPNCSGSGASGEPAREAMQDAYNNIQQSQPSEEDIDELNDSIERQMQENVQREVDAHPVWGSPH